MRAGRSGFNAGIDGKNEVSQQRDGGVNQLLVSFCISPPPSTLNDRQCRADLSQRLVTEAAKKSGRDNTTALVIEIA